MIVFLSLTLQYRLATFLFKTQYRFVSIVMSAPKHLTKGSQCPPLAENQLRLYAMRFCPFVQRAKLVLTAKNIPFEEININMSEKPEWYLEKNPTGQLPGLEWIESHCKETRFVPESLVVCDFLDETRPETRLHPADPYIKAKQRILVERYGSVTTPFYKILRGDDAPKGIVDMNNGLMTYEQALKETFFGGSTPTMVDYMLWPWFERFPYLEENGYVFNSDGKFPKLAAWVKAMEANETVRKVKVPVAIMKKFMDGYVKGVAEFDFE